MPNERKMGAKMSLRRICCSYKITVADLEKLPLIKVGNQTVRLPSEKVLIQMTGKIIRKSLEADGDYHVEISDVSCKDSTVATEFVSPADKYAKESPYIENFTKVRAFILGKKVGDRITVTGLEFQDKFHSPSPHRIRNFKEIHPVLFAK